MGFIRDLLSEGSPISSKRWIALTISAVICYGSIVVIHKYPNLIAETLKSLMVFVAVMSGVATVAQVLSILKGTPMPKDENGTQTKIVTTTNQEKEETTILNTKTE